MSTIQLSVYRARQPQRTGWLLVLLLLIALPTWASDYYWVGGTGQWNDLSHWSPSSGGPATYSQVPQSTDNVYFDAQSFSASNQTVTIGGIMTCQDLDWTGAVHAGVSGMRFIGSGTLEVNGDLRLAAGLGRQDINFRLLATTTGHILDLQAVPVNGWLSLESVTGGWVCRSDLNLVQYNSTPSLLLMAGRIDFGTTTVSCYGVRSTGNMVRTLNLNAATFNLLAAVNAWEVSGTNLTLQAGTSILRLGSTAHATSNVYAFSSTAQVYNEVEVAVGASATLNVANSSFSTLTINGLVTLTSAATVTSTLSVGRDAVLRPAAGQVLTLGPQAKLALTSSCAGLAHLQSSVPGQVATIQQAAGWNGITLNYAVLQDIALGGGGTAQALNCLDRGNNAGVAFTALPVSDLYWVGGTGSWHDTGHWASASGGKAGGCLPTLATNVHFDLNSFGASKQVVTLDGPNAFCRDLDFTGANAPIFSTAATDLGQHQLGIGGSLTLTSGQVFSAKADLVFYGHEASAPTATVATAGQALAGNVYFRAPGSTYTLLDALALAPGATSPNGRLYVEAGTLATNSQTVTCQGFTSGYAATGSVFTTGSGAAGPVSSAAVAVNLGSSTLNLTPASALSDVGLRSTYTWDVAPGVALTAGASTIRIGSNSTRNQAAVFRGGQGAQYNVVLFTDPAALSLPTVVPGSTAAAATFARLAFAGSANLSANNNFTNSLELAGGRIYNFYNTTQTFTATGQLLVAGTCAGFVNINGGTGTARVKFSKPAGGTANQPIVFSVLRNATFQGGATWTATQSIDNTGNSGITFASPPVPRTLYWVGGTGNWTDSGHWSLSTGGTGGTCMPNQLDAAIFDNLSFTAPSQVVTQDALLAACRTMSWAAVTTNSPVFSGPATNTLAVYGSLTWCSAMSQQLLGEVQLLAGGTLTSNGQPFGGSLLLNAPTATISLADALTQPRNAGSGLTQTAGALLTNGQPLLLRSLTSAPPDADPNPPTRALRLGASTVEITAGAWAPTDPTTLTVEAGAATINLSTGTSFVGGGFAYDVVQTGPGASHTVTGSNAIGSLQLAGINQVTGSNTIGQQLSIAAGSAVQFGAGTTTTFAATATVQAVGTGPRVIILQSTVHGQTFTWSKPAGTVCANYIYLRDSRAQGGAYFEAGQQANNQGNTSGWSFASLPQATYGSQQVCPQLGAHYLRFAFSGLDRLTQQPTTLAATQYPLTLVLRNLTTNTTSTISVTGPTYDHLVPDSQTSYQYQVLSVATNSASCTPLVNTGAATPFPVVTDGPLNGTPGQWIGTTTSWLDCQNWADGQVPTAATDVTIGPAAAAPVLNVAGMALGGLHVLAGGRLTLSSTAELTVSGHWLNEGTTTVDDASQVTFGGSSAQQVLNGQFGQVVVNNAAGLTLLSDASSTVSLALTAGIITTGSYQWVHTNPVSGSLSGGSAGSYVAGRLRRTLASGSSDTYAFPVGTTSQYAHLDLLSSQLTGTNTLEASFAPKTDPDAGLNCVDTAPSALRYVAVQSAGRWLLVPDAQPTGGTYAVRASLAPFSNLTDNMFGILKRPDASTSAADWTTGGGTLSAAGGAGRLVADGYALRSGLSSFSQFGLGQAVPNAPLPVTLVSFQATTQGTAAQLSWTVAQELNLSGYAVERSLDGRSFEPVGQVAAKGGMRQTYTFADALASRVAAGQPLYYRLRMLEPGAPDAYSLAVAVQFTSEATSLFAWPTRFTTELHVAGTDLHQVELLDELGRVVYRQDVPAGSTTLLSGQHLAPGLYMLQATTATGLHHLRVVRE